MEAAVYMRGYTVRQFSFIDKVSSLQEECIIIWETRVGLDATKIQYFGMYSQSSSYVCKFCSKDDTVQITSQSLKLLSITLLFYSLYLKHRYPYL